MDETGFTEVIVSSDSASHLCNTCIRDLQTQAAITTYKTGNSESRTLSFIGSDYLIGAQIDKPVLNVWTIGKMHREESKFICPGVVTSLAVSSDAHYCVGAVGEKLYLWLVSTGDLLAVLDGHYQMIKCIKFTDDSTHFLSGGADGLVLTWRLSRILCSDAYGVRKPPEPCYVWKDHTYDVTDIYVGYCGLRARAVTVSLDQTCKLYELFTGGLLLNICTNYLLTSVTMDPAEYHIFIGTVAGKILQVNLYSDIHLKELHYTEEESAPVFQGHGDRVSCLSVSVDGTILLSGSDDKTVKLWDIDSKMCTAIIKHAGPVTNAFIKVAPSSLFCNEKVQPKCLLSPFKRTLSSNKDQEQEDEDVFSNAVAVKLKSRELSTFFDGYNDEAFNKAASKGEIDIGTKSKEILQKELQQLEIINKQIYSFSVNSFLNCLRSNTEE